MLHKKMSSDSAIVKFQEVDGRRIAYVSTLEGYRQALAEPSVDAIHVVSGAWDIPEAPEVEVIIRGRSDINIYCDMDVTVVDLARVTVRGQSSVFATGAAQVLAMESASVIANSSASIVARDSVSVFGYGACDVRAYGDASVCALDEATVSLFERSTGAFGGRVRVNVLGELVSDQGEFRAFGKDCAHLDSRGGSILLSDTATGWVSAEGFALATGASVVYAQEGAFVWAEDQARVSMFDRSEAQAAGRAHVIRHDESLLIINEGSQVTLDDSGSESVPVGDLELPGVVMGDHCMWTVHLDAEECRQGQLWAEKDAPLLVGDRFPLDGWGVCDPSSVCVDRVHVDNLEMDEAYAGLKTVTTTVAVESASPRFPVVAARLQRLEQEIAEGKCV